MKINFILLSMSVLTLMASFTGYGQTTNSAPLNLDFETVESGSFVGWWSTFPVTIDSVHTFHGKYSALLEIPENSEIQNQSITCKFPYQFEGDTIILSGYIKTENVRDGYAGLWLRIDPQQASDILNSCKITGTTEWTKYEIRLPFDPRQTTGILGGGALFGKGKMWMDSLTFQVDGQDISTLLRPKIYPAERDSVEFKAGSGIAPLQLNCTRLDNLADLGKIWGFLKYYHPSVREGNYNWDYELFRILPRIIDLKDKKQRDAVFVEWIDGLGKIETTYDYEADTLSALKWIEESNFSPDLTARLIEIRDAKRIHRSYYVRSAGAGTPEFTHENSYESMKYPDVGYRLLSLYRYWNIIQYFFPYKDIIGKDWEQVLTTYVPRFVNAKDEKEYLLASLELAAEVNDSHAYTWVSSSSTLIQYYGLRKAVPRIRFIEDRAVVTSFFNDTLDRNHGLEIGDVITRLDNRSMKSIIRSRMPVTAGSNYRVQLRDIAIRLLRSNNESIRIKYQRDGRSGKTTLKTFPQAEANLYFREKPYSDTCFRLITPQIAYLFPELLKKGDFQRLWNEVKNTKGLIIDLRFLESDYLFDVANYLMPAPQEFVKFTKCNTIIPGAFIETPTVKIGMPNEDYYKGKVIVLVNENTQSSKEYMTMAFSKCPDVRVIGSTTAGADGNVTLIVLPGGIHTMISGSGVFYPDGGQTQRVGVRIDEIVEPTIEGIKAGRDEVLERAIEIINSTSTLEIPAVNDRTIENLEILCKVWGFVKYYHPAMADSTIDMDAELFGLLPQIVEASPKERNKTLCRWIKKFGHFRQNATRYRQMLDTMDYEQCIDLSWIDDQEMLGKELSNKLNDLRYAERDSNHYISYVFPQGNLKFNHEKDYPNVSDRSVRLLALFRYWNIIEYFFPYKSLMDKSWDQVLKEYLPTFILSDKKNDYDAAVARLSTELDDAHAITNSGIMFNWRSARIDFGVIENKFIVRSSDRFTENGEKRLLPGDEIVEINSMPLDSTKARIARYIAHSNQSSLNSCFTRFGATPLPGTNTVQIGYLRNSEKRDTTIVVDNNVPVPKIEQQPFELLNDSIGYIYAGKFDYKIKNDLIKALKNTKGIIVDLRCYPSAFMVYPFIHEWLLNDSASVAIFSYPLVNMPGYFGKKNLKFGTRSSNSYQGNIIVLVNDQTMSQAEYTTMVLQANPRTMVIGSQTNGADGNVSFVQLPGGSRTSFSGMGVYYPDGGQTQRIGVRIDEIVEPTIEGVKAGRDEVLERAIEIIANQP